jgi:serine/threonine-protein kinase RsbW
MRLYSLGVLRLSDLDSAVTEVHSYFDEWRKKHARDGSAVHEARFAAHEWMANLVQHANFRGRRPQIVLDVQRNGAFIRCVITDNSEGFDLEWQLEKAYDQNSVQVLPGRGMGLLMLQACTSKLSYEATERGRHRLSFQVAPEINRTGFNASAVEHDAA